MDDERRTAVVRILAEIDQRIAKAEAIIATPVDRQTELRAQVLLADMENARYEVEGELGGQ
jgi:hypothetical protein